MKFKRMYEFQGGKPFQGAFESYRIGLAEDGQLYSVFVDTVRPPRLLQGGMLSVFEADEHVARGLWTLYTPDNGIVNRTDNDKEPRVNLNIDFAAIIAKADHRRAGLQELQEELQMLPQMEQQLRESLGYFEQLRELYRKLDDEGKALVGDAGESIDSFGYICRETLVRAKAEEGFLAGLFKDLGLEWQA